MGVFNGGFDIFEMGMGYLEITVKVDGVGS